MSEVDYQKVVDGGEVLLDLRVGRKGRTVPSYNHKLLSVKSLKVKTTV